MTSGNLFDAAVKALDDCDAALGKLDKLCCEPGRSPSMKALARTLAAARAGLDDPGADMDGTLAHLEDAGAQVGRLQVGCCTPVRLPLYATFLEGLTTAQLAINRSMGLGH
ncbi:MAG TPA: hypothetical protein VLT15_03940 [Acidimicrobiia bacterium]|nr:hypothetical protein [Acidimicrobiia bacterium]